MLRYSKFVFDVSEWSSSHNYTSNNKSETTWIWPEFKVLFKLEHEPYYFILWYFADKISLSRKNMDKNKSSKNLDYKMIDIEEKWKQKMILELQFCQIMSIINVCQSKLLFQKFLYWFTYQVNKRRPTVIVDH